MVCSGFEPSGLRIEGADKFLLLDDQISGRQNEIPKIRAASFRHKSTTRKVQCTIDVIFL